MIGRNQVAATIVRQSFATQLTYMMSTIWNYAGEMKVIDPSNKKKWRRPEPVKSKFGPGTAALGQDGRFISEATWWQWMTAQRVNTFAYRGITIKW